MSDFNFRNTQEFREQCGYDIEGLWYPRVTKIIDIKSKPALYKFYASLSSYDEGRAIADQSAAEGTRVHEALQSLLLGRKADVDQGIQPSVEAFKTFLEGTPIETKPEWVERRVWHPLHRYAGTIDVIAKIGDKLGVLDIKTSQSIYRDYNLQTAAYMDTLKNEFEDLSTRWILRVDQYHRCARCNANLRTKGGREKIRSYGQFQNGCNHNWLPAEGVVELKEFPSWQTDFEAFLSAKKLWEWENEDWLRKLGYNN